MHRSTPCQKKNLYHYTISFGCICIEKNKVVVVVLALLYTKLHALELSWNDPFVVHCVGSIGPLLDRVTWYGINYARMQITQWDFQN